MNVLRFMIGGGGGGGGLRGLREVFVGELGGGYGGRGVGG